jgi:SAM-dependent methyltransferase
VVLADINASMLSVGRDRLIDRGAVGNVQFAQANAECLPFPDNTFDCITIAFGLRNVTDKDKALRSMLLTLLLSVPLPLIKCKIFLHIQLVHHRTHRSIRLVVMVN